MHAKSGKLIIINAKISQGVLQLLVWKIMQEKNNGNMWDMLTASWVSEFPIHGKFEHLKSVLFYQHVVPIMKNNCEAWQLLELCTVGPDSAEARSPT